MTTVTSEYSDCPQYCPRDSAKPYSAHRTLKCKGCPKKVRYEKFERDVEVIWEKWLAREQLKRIDYFKMLDKMQTALRLQGSKTLNVIEAEFVNILEQEETRFDKVAEERSA